MPTGVPQRDRSPGYPIVALGEALGRLAEFEAHFKRGGAPPARAGEAWGIKAKAYTDRIVAALRYFGLMDYQDHGGARLVVVSDEGRRYLRAQRDETRQEVIAGAALRPKQIARYWTVWGAHRPPDAACLDELILVNGFSETGAREFLKVYDGTISFIRSTAPGSMTPGVERSRGTAEYAGSETAIPSPRIDASDTPAGGPPPGAAGDGSETAAIVDEERFVADEGAVVIRFPPGLGSASVDDLEAFFALFIRKARRRAGTREQGHDGR